MKMLSKLWRDEWIKLVGFVVLMGVFSVLQVLLWPTMKKMLPGILKVVPDQLKWLISGMQTEGFTYYTVTQQLMKNVGIFGSALAIILGASAVAREMETGTMELLLAQPISRRRVLFEKYLFHLFVLATPLVFSTLLVAPAARMIGESAGLGGLFASGVYCFFIMATLYSFVFLLGVLIDTQLHVIMGGIAACLVMFVLAIFRATRFLSLYGYMDIHDLRPILVGAHVPWAEMFVFALLSAGLFAVAVLRFSRRTI